MKFVFLNYSGLTYCDIERYKRQLNYGKYFALEFGTR